MIKVRGMPMRWAGTWMVFLRTSEDDIHVITPADAWELADQWDSEGTPIAARLMRRVAAWCDRHGDGILH